MNWTIKVIDPETGQERCALIEASTRDEAMEIAKARGFVPKPPGYGRLQFGSEILFAFAMLHYLAAVVAICFAAWRSLSSVHWLVDAWWWYVGAAAACGATGALFHAISGACEALRDIAQRQQARRE